MICQKESFRQSLQPFSKISITIKIDKQNEKISKFHWVNGRIFIEKSFEPLIKNFMIDCVGPYHLKNGKKYWGLIIVCLAHFMVTSNLIPRPDTNVRIAKNLSKILNFKNIVYSMAHLHQDHAAISAMHGN